MKTVLRSFAICLRLFNQYTREKIESKMHDPDLITAMKLNQISYKKLLLNHTIRTKTTKSAWEQRACSKIHFCDYK